MPDAGFDRVFARLRAMMLEVVDDALDVTRDVPGDLVVRTRRTDAKGQPGWFGTVTTKKAYVAYHLMPLYERPDVLDGLDEALARRRHGKTCFNFRRPDEAAFAELAALTEAMRATLD